MKTAKLKSTGRVIKLNEKVSLLDYARGLYRDTDGNSYHWRNLEFIEEKTDSIDWEQRRYEIAKECVAVLMCNNKITLEGAAKIAVEQADVLIAELKESKKP